MINKRIVKLRQSKTVVPWQVCPKCGGWGNLVNSPRLGNSGFTTSSLVVTCDVCNGAKIIPMALV